MFFLATSCRGTALPKQKGKALYQQLSWMEKVERMLYSSRTSQAVEKTVKSPWQYLII